MMLRHQDACEALLHLSRSPRARQPVPRTPRPTHRQLLFRRLETLQPCEQLLHQGRFRAVHLTVRSNDSQTLLCEETLPQQEHERLAAVEPDFDQERACQVKADGMLAQQIQAEENQRGPIARQSATATHDLYAATGRRGNGHVEPAHDLYVPTGRGGNGHAESKEGYTPASPASTTAPTRRASPGGASPDVEPRAVCRSASAFSSPGPTVLPDPNRPGWEVVMTPIDGRPGEYCCRQRRCRDRHRHAGSAASAAGGPEESHCAKATCVTCGKKRRRPDDERPKSQ